MLTFNVASLTNSSPPWTLNTCDGINERNRIYSTSISLQFDLLNHRYGCPYFVPFHTAVGTGLKFHARRRTATVRPLGSYCPTAADWPAAHPVFGSASPLALVSCNSQHCCRTLALLQHVVFRLDGHWPATQ